MHALQPLLLGFGLLIGEKDVAAPRGADLAQLQEMLRDRQHPHGQSQAALLLVQSRGERAENAVREGLRRVESNETFLALAAAVRLQQDRRFLDELLAALSCGRPAIREAAAQTLAVLADASLVKRLQELAKDNETDVAVRQIALWTLGRCGSKDAARALLDGLRDDNEVLRRSAAAALRDLSGQDYGIDGDRWRFWWEQHKDLTNERWLETRLRFQTSRAHRLEDDLNHSRAQLLRLEQQLYSRLSVSERIAHIQSLVNQDDPALRALAVTWSIELLATAEADQKHSLAQMLLSLSHDSSIKVRRAAILGLGRVRESGVFERLQRLTRSETPEIRVSALHALAMHSRGNEDEKAVRRKQVMPLLQKSLNDPALEVVVAAAEELGALGARGAGPVLTELLRHPSEMVRQAAAQALERVADPSVFPKLLEGLDDTCSTVRFNLIGALARTADENNTLSDDRRKRMAARLEQLLLRDADPGVRSRAATALGECATPEHLEALWQSVLAGDDVRVRDKAWKAFVDILTRAGKLSVLQEWDNKLKQDQQGPRRLQMLGEVATNWQRQARSKELVVPTQELLICAQLELGKWSAALPVLREMLSRPANEAELNRRLDWLHKAGEQALHEGNRAEALRTIEIARPFLPAQGTLTDAFEKLRKDAEP